MTSIGPTEQTPEVEVTVWLDGELVEQRYCDTVDEASALADAWADRGSVTINIHPIGEPNDPEDDPMVDMGDEGHAHDLPEEELPE